MNESKADRFRRIAEARVNKIIKTLRLLGNCSRYMYESSEEQVNKIFSTLQQELDEAKAQFSPTKRKRFSLSVPEPFEPSSGTICGTLQLSDGTALYAVVDADPRCPTIKILCQHGDSTDLTCFVEFIPDGELGNQLFVGAYNSLSEDTQYYDSFFI